ncbi:hypothetical protein AN618_01050 [Fervidicola ferrireducens]|uniref:Alpha-glucosidase n=1 Tax=Fervidicola ferrireducens TaxID=520764 RepID=A0A140LDZ2_9FIRM|nr:hypothetical protein [Fervidicola ferrireducens]KXG78767.1 hypothetical protein AN618_01050 [Fervidicola ferrireducens]
MENEIFGILTSIEKKLNSSSISPRIRASLTKELEKAKNRYRNFDADLIKGETQKQVYESLLKKGKALLKNGNNLNEVYSFLRYANAAYFDFTNSLGPLNTGIRLFTLTSALLMALSPQFVGAVFSLVLVLPIFLGLNALKKRRAMGYTMALFVFPVSFAVSTLWLRFGYRVLKDYSGVLSETVQATGKSPEFARLLITIPPVLSLLLLISACLMIYKLFKARDMLI